MKYKINELAQLLDVSTNTIRKYENMGYIKPIRDNVNNYRYYDEESIEVLFSIKLMRKYGFTHNEIEKVNNMSMEESIAEYQTRLDSIDKEIEFLKNMRHRFKDDLILMKKSVQSNEFTEMDCVSMMYVIYKDGEKLLKEKERLEKMQELFNESPEIQRIFIIAQDDLMNGNIVLKSGWAVKQDDMERYHMTENKYTDMYPKKMSVMGIIKMPIAMDETFQSVKKREDFVVDGRDQLGEFFEYIDAHNYKIAGDAICIVIKTVVEDGKKYLYMLHSIPVE